MNAPIIRLGRKELGGGDVVNINLAELENQFWLCLGKSGSGKSHTVRHIIDQMSGYQLDPRNGGMPPTFHVIGYHPDFGYEHFQKSGAFRNIGPESINTLDFDYKQGDASINPLQPLTNDPSAQFATIEDFIAYCKVVHPGIGAVQIKYIRDILDNVYKRCSKEGVCPDVTDLHQEIQMIKKSLKSGLGVEATRAMQKLRKEQIEKEKQFKSKETDTKGKEKLEGELNDLVAEMVDEFATYIKQNTIWVKDEYYADFDLSTVSTLDVLVAGLIRPNFFTRDCQARPRQGLINVYDIHKLGERHQELMTHVLLTRLYKRCIATTPSHMLNPSVAHTYIVADEVRYMNACARDLMSPANLIMGGSRKFGMGMLVGGQGADQLSSDMARAFSVKIILDQNEAAYNDTKKFFRVNESILRKIISKRSAFIKSGSMAELVNLFV